MNDPIYLLPVWNTITTAWDKIKGTKVSVWAAIAIIILIILGLIILQIATQSFSSRLPFFIQFIEEIVNLLLFTGMFYIGIERAFGLPISYRLMFRAFEATIALKIIILTILRMLILLPSIIVLMLSTIPFVPSASPFSLSFVVIQFIGFLLFLIAIISLIYLSIRMRIASAFVLDKKANAWEAIKLSFQATRSNVWRLIAISLIQIGIMFISLIPAGIGLIWSIPFYFTLYGELYKKLSINTTVKNNI